MPAGTGNYAKGMKTAVSIPDNVFQHAEKLARKTKKSRSQIYSEALQEYVARHGTDEVTEAMNRTLEEIDDPIDAFVVATNRATLKRSEW